MPAVKPVTVPELIELSEDLGLKCTEDELKELKGSLSIHFNIEDRDSDYFLISGLKFVSALHRFLC